jgi:peptidase M49-like protein
MNRFLPLTFLAMTALAATPDLAELNRMIARFAPAQIGADPSHLVPGDQKALQKLLDAARVINDIFITQLWSGNAALREKLTKDTTPLGQARLHYFNLNNGPWSDLDDHAAFLPDVPLKILPGANFYPEDLTRDEFETWVGRLPHEQQEDARGFFTVIRRTKERKLYAVPYDSAYQAQLEKAAVLLGEAAALTPNASLKEFLTLRAKAFRSNDYYDSDVAWMKLDAPIDIAIGPYETYNDELFGYKASFEAYVTLRDDRETEKLKAFAAHIQEIENNLPLDAKFRNPKLGALAPIRVVNEVLATGDGAHGVRTAAFNLPNDERIVRAMGSKRVMLKNVQEAKFSKTLEPIARRVLPAAAQGDLDFDAFFSHILAHEMTHGIGPQNGVRQALKELHSAIEEAKADATGLFMLQYLYNHKLMPEAEHKLYTTYLASSFRTLRFGVHEAHGKGMALQFNYLTDKGAFVENADGTFAVNFEKIKPAVRDLIHDLLTIEANGDYAGAKKMLDELGVLRPSMNHALEKLKDIPVDIEPIR